MSAQIRLSKSGRFGLARMVTEKILAAGKSQMTAAAAAMRGLKKHVVAGKALNVYSKRVRANRRRLSR
jgi:hypothetical protein